MIAGSRHPLVPLALALLLGGVEIAHAQTHTLTLRVRNAQSGLPTAARVHLRGDGVDLLDLPDPVLRTHLSPRLGAYLHVVDSLVVELPAGPVTIEAVRGTEGILSFDVINLQAPTVHTITVDDWIDAKSLGWYSGDPHVHSVHDEGAEYPPTSLEQSAKAARAEGLDFMALLDNDALNPGGPVVPPWPETTLVWGEEYRAAFWGHVVLLGLDDLVLDGNSAGCCSQVTDVWPTLAGKLEGLGIPFAYIAHPQTVDFLSNASRWPGGGHARELRSIALGSTMHGVAVSGATNTPEPWAHEAYLDALRAGAQWAAMGEGDRPLDRHGTTAPGMPRTYAYLDTAIAPGDTALGTAWIEAVRARRCFATTGPILHTLEVDGARMGETLSLGAPGTVSLDLGFESHGRIEDLWIHTSTGTPLHWNWPLGRASLDTTITWTVAHDDFVVVEIQGPGDDWPGIEHDPGAISSPVWIDAGQPWPWLTDVARRGADELAEVWNISITDRYYASAAESLAAREDILGASDFYEAVVDDPPGNIVLLSPPTGVELQVTAFALEWSAAFSYDQEPITYRVIIARDSTFTDVVLDQITTATTLAVTTLTPGERYVWKVESLEPVGESTVALNAPWTLRLDENAVSVPVAASSLFALHPVKSGVRLELGRAATVSMDIIDVRGRRVRRLEAGTLEAGEHSFSWDGRDDGGVRVGRGVYWYLARSEGRQFSIKVVRLR